MVRSTVALIRCQTVWLKAKRDFLLGMASSSEWFDDPAGDDDDYDRFKKWNDWSDDEQDDSDVDSCKGEAAKAPTSPPSKAEAERALEELLVNLHLRGGLNAKMLCVVAFWCKHAGVGGPLGKFALRPNSPSGHFNRKVRTALGLDSADARCMRISVPGHDRHDVGRVLHEVAVLPPHEVLNAEIVRNPSLLTDHARSVSKGGLPPIYSQHPVAAATGHAALPVCLYMDGVPYSTKDSLLGVWVYFAHSSRRHLVAALRKSRMCRCGCRGWCSFYELFRWLAWSFMSLAVGLFPATRHDGKLWQVYDSERESLAGKAMELTAAVVAIKGDWAEYCHTIGLSTWKSNLHPCFYCWTTKATMHDDDNATSTYFPCGRKTHEDYEMACRACEHPRSITGAQHLELLASLRYDKRKQGSHGRALKHDVPSCRLLRGDRLEPSDDLPDVGAFDSIDSFPARVLFWRPRDESFVRHRNPIFNVTIGIELTSLMVDLLHTLNLGVMKQFCTDAVWEALVADVYGVRPGRGQDEYLACAVEMLRHDLFSWYKKKRDVYPGMTILQDLTVPMLGRPESRHLKTKAAETKWFLYFLHDFLVAHGSKLHRGSSWLSAAASLLQLTHMLEKGPRVFKPSECKESLACRWGVWAWVEGGQGRRREKDTKQRSMLC